jgi:predicted RNA-binding protein
MRETQESHRDKWLGKTTDENWKQCVKYGLWGADDNRLSQIKRLRKGDYLMVFVGKMKLAGIYNVSRECFHDTSNVWAKAKYPHRIEISPFKVPSEPLNIRDVFNKRVRPVLLVKGNNRGTAKGYFGQGLRSLPENEFSIFESEIDKSLENKPMVNKRQGNISYNELVKYLNENRMQANYQPVVIKILIDNKGGRITRQLIVDTFSL